MKTIAILSALPREIALIQERFPGSVVREGGLNIMHHVAGDVHIFSAYGGMGTTNIAAATQTLITVARFLASTPEALIFTGIAGNLNARLGFADVVLAQKLVYEETDTQIIAEDPPYQEVFGSTPRLVQFAQEFVQNHGMTAVENNASTPQAAEKMYPSVDSEQTIRAVPQELDAHTEDLAAHRFTVGTVATSNLFSTDYETLTRIITEDHADAEEMEGAAVSHVCMKNGIDHLVIRALSNDCGEAYEDLDQRQVDLNISARVAAHIAVGVVEKIVNV
ncbi:5'-methylthioadenosine/S-adenosylhomocysteine nucleosidase family protein [Alloscardovia criceti]|uniref:5'-methylthioadenosine/S-adenosylhomocysteine nucleosidase family protein n=1 Tax=Alloscardovia criceti TaxID=356828 RepID=UPI00035DF10A|nr:5'-methylthioadenosine/S-adenosylhomocysteine nucleosidase [Alloscardovia criceti]